MLSEILEELSNHPWKSQIHYFEEIDSTNNYAKTLANQGAPEGTIVIAEAQTGGRGRMGRSFSSPACSGLYMSVILRPNCHPMELMHLTCATGVAASNAIERATGIRPSIKWTNDLVIGNRKLGGILTEMSVNPATQKVQWAVIGIGINCCQKSWQFPAEIRDIACSLNMNWLDTPPLFAALIDALYIMCKQLFSDKTDIMEAFRTRCITIGQYVSILQGEQVRHGTAVGVDDEGGLIVQYADGAFETVASGEVSIRGMYGYL